MTANIQARASRGLYNGGVVPLGYKINPERRGYLEVDDEQARIVKEAFASFIREGSLSIAAKWLNKNGYRFTRNTQGGGNAPRLGHFTNQNLCNIIKNKAYIGVKTYQVRGETREAKAVWSPIIDEQVFARAHEILKRIYRSMPAYNEKKYAFPLTGILVCATCGERLCGKTAHGNSGKVPYYEHAWTTKRQSCLVSKVFSCNPNRILAKVIEPKVWEIVERVLSNPKEAEMILAQAKTTHATKNKGNEAVRLKAKIAGIDSQLEALAERIASLPKTISATPFLKQMEKIEALKLEEKRDFEMNNFSPVDRSNPRRFPRTSPF